MVAFIDMIVGAGSTPPKTTEGNAGIDLCASEGGVIHANRSKHISTGVHMAIPSGYKGVVYGRSGLAFNHNARSQPTAPVKMKQPGATRGRLG